MDVNPHAELSNLALEQGLVLNGVKPKLVEGRGTGIVTTRPVKSGEIVITVPIQLIRTFHTIPASTVQKLPDDITLHALLSIDLILNSTDTTTLWNASFPSSAVFEATTPLLWPAELQSLLPKPAKGVLLKQQNTFQRDWNIVSDAFPEVSRSEYLHAWLLINTRTFWYTTEGMERFESGDSMALLPVADFINHADQGCEVSFSTESFTFTADRDYDVDEEIHICYGRYSNDALLAEYGFVLLDNQWDEVCLDELFLSSLNEQQTKDLASRDYLGNYVIDEHTPGCHRTQVLLRRLCCTRKQWQQFVDGFDDGESSQAKVDVTLAHFLDQFEEAIQQKLQVINESDAGKASQRDILRQRWNQIAATVSAANRLLKE